MKRTTTLAMVSFHPIIPGGPTQRGLLYRPSHMNMYSRLQMIDWSQRTEEEARMYKWQVHPEQSTLLVIGGLVLVSQTYYCLFGNDEPKKLDRTRRYHFDGMDEEEVWMRNWEMEKVFKQHKELIKETREKYAPNRPEVFDPPRGHAAWHDPSKANFIF